MAIRSQPDGGTIEEPVAAELVERLCIDDEQLAKLSWLADRCEEVYGPARDIEWAIAGGVLYLLQCRAVTRIQGQEQPAAMKVSDPIEEEIKQVPLFAGLRGEELERVRGLFKERRFAAGETVVMEGSDGAAFFLIEAGDASVTVRGAARGSLGPGDHFGEPRQYPDRDAIRLI